VAMGGSIGILLSLYCCAASASCNITDFDRATPKAIKGAVNTPLVNFEYASDIDAVDGQLRLWNYVLNRTARGLGVDWPKAGISSNLWLPLPPGEAACKFDTVSEIRTDPDAPITYGTTDEVQSATVFASNAKKLGSTNSAIRTSYRNDEGKSVSIDVQLSTFQTPQGIGMALEHSPGIVIGIAGLPKVLTAEQIEKMSLSAKAQDAAVEQATYLEYTKKDPREALAPLIRSEKDRPSEKTPFLFFSGSSAKLGFDTDRAVERVSADVVILDEKSKRPLFATDFSLLVPAAK
jgi:hypothetical protein